MRVAGRGDLTHRWLRRPAGPAARFAGAVLLLVLAALGSAAREVTHLSTAGLLVPVAQPAAAIAGVAAVVAACVVLAGVLVLLGRRRRRRREDEFSIVPQPVGPWWARALAAIAALALLALPVTALVVLARGRHGGQLTAPPAVPKLPGLAPSPGSASATFLLGAVAAVAALVVGVLVVTAVWLRRRRQAGTARHGTPAAPSPLAVAVAAGTAALGVTAGASEAIIACYAAMEATLGAAGSPRRAADTPEELLNRAEGDGIIRTPAARRLTALFREARFSPHRLADAQRHAALAALDDIGHDLAGGP